jgi:Ca2+/H+ antiporter, TMEM165/GDT1 family
VIGMRIRKILKILLIGLVACTVFGFAVKLLWNWLMPGIFGLHTISFWQALGLFILGKILFGGFRGRPGRGGGHWRARMRERWERMTPEERQRFQEGIKSRCDRFSRRPEQTA